MVLTRKHTRRGFTSTEVLLSVVILGTVSSVGLPHYSHLVEASQEVVLEVSVRAVDRNAVLLALYEMEGAGASMSPGGPTYVEVSFGEVHEPTLGMASRDGNYYTFAQGGALVCLEASREPAKAGTVTPGACPEIRKP